MSKTLSNDTDIDTILKEPSRYKVILLNDDVTPMEFVVSLLIKVFKFSNKKAVKLTTVIHETESATVGVFSYELAEQKIVESLAMCKKYDFPLKIVAEVADE